MKKLWVVLLSLGLVLALCSLGSAQTKVKFAGSYYVVGLYENNVTLGGPDSRSRALFATRTRLMPEFQIVEGLKLNLQMDVLEKQWGNANWRRGAAVGDDTPSSRTVDSVAGANQKIQESIEFELAYVTFMTGIGQFAVGYQYTEQWGTTFMNATGSKPMIYYSKALGPLTLEIKYVKSYEADRTSVAANVGKVDADWDTYGISGIYKWKGGEAGLSYRYFDDKSRRPANDYKSSRQVISPYVKATIGPVYLEAELEHDFGKAREFDGAGVNVDYDTWAAYLDGKLNLGPAYVGAFAFYASGDDGSDPTKSKASVQTSTSFNRMLVMMNDDFSVWTESTSPVSAASGNKSNRIAYQLYGGYKVTPKLDLFASLTQVLVDKKGTAVDAKFGTELDVTATYKIYDQLSYMVGGAYIWIGDYLKGATPAKEIGNDYVLINKLTLSF